MGRLVLVCLLPLALGLTPRQKSDRITELPGLNFVSYVDQYSGYLNASRTGGRFLHYWLIESQGTPATDPVIVWFNGGPGCSSLTGALFENGPFHVNQDGRTLWENVHAWNKLGSILYVEGPTGVGFSYATDPEVEQHHSDDTASMEFYLALDDFFANVRPDLQSNDLYITGESYAGVYIPTVTQRLVDNAATFKGNLKGMAIGNGLLSEKLQTNSVIAFLYFHGIIGQETWEDLHKCCNSTCTADCDFYQHLTIPSPTNEPVAKNTSCGQLVFYVSDTLVSHTENDPYNIYNDCYNSPQVRVAFQRSIGFWRRASNNAEFLNYDSTDNDNGFTCWGQDTMQAYLNRPEVWKAFNIRNELTDRPNWKWEWCNEYRKPPFIHEDSLVRLSGMDKSFTRLYTDLDRFFDHIYTTDPDFRILIYNGDTDLVCNFLGDQWFMTAFARRQGIDKLPTSRPRYPWMYRGQIGGYVKSYDRVDVATVKGSGHFVPTTRPGPMLQLLANFFRNTANYSTPDGIDIRAAPLANPVVWETSSAIAQSCCLALLLFSILV